MHPFDAINRFAASMEEDPPDAAEKVGRMVTSKTVSIAASKAGVPEPVAGFAGSVAGEHMDKEMAEGIGTKALTFGGVMVAAGIGSIASLVAMPFVVGYGLFSGAKAVRDAFKGD